MKFFKYKNPIQCKIVFNLVLRIKTASIAVSEENCKAAFRNYRNYVRIVFNEVPKNEIYTSKNQEKHETSNISCLKTTLRTKIN